MYTLFLNTIDNTHVIIANDMLQLIPGSSIDGYLTEIATSDNIDELNAMFPDTPGLIN